MPNSRTYVNSFTAMQLVTDRLLKQLQLLQSFTSKYRLHFVDNRLIYARSPITNIICQMFSKSNLTAFDSLYKQLARTFVHSLTIIATKSNLSISNTTNLQRWKNVSTAGL